MPFDDLVGPDGKRWAPSLESTTARPKAKRDAKPMHAGWCAEGVSPATIARARKAMDDSPNFNAEQFANSGAARRERVTKPLCSMSAAEGAATLARRQGWLAVSIVEVKRGGVQPSLFLDGGAGHE